MTFLLFIGMLIYFFFSLRGLEKKHLWATLTSYGIVLLSTRVLRLYSSNQTVSALLFVTSLAVLTLSVYTLGLDQPGLRSLWEFISVPFRTLGGYVRGTWFAFLSLFRGPARVESRTTSHWSIVRSMFVGTLLAIPVIAALLSMLEGADPIFAYNIKQLFSWNILWEIPARIWWSLLLYVFLVPFAFFRLHDRVRSPFTIVAKLGWHRELTVVMTLVAVTVASFLIIQWPYVFASVPAETDLSRFGVATYSEYVKKGFGELLRVSVFLYSIVWVGLLTIRDKEKKLVAMLSWLQWIVMGELFLFVVSVFRRIWLYQMHHGWTLVRIYGGVFLLWLCGMIIFLALRHVAKKRWVTGEMIMTAAVVLGLSLFNVEHFIATTHPPTVNKRVDYVYLSRMSPDGYIGWKMSYDWARSVLLTRGLDKEPHISRENRRDIAYAGHIVLRLLRHHHDLIVTYGSHEEIDQYASFLRDYEKIRDPNVTSTELISRTGVVINQTRWLAESVFYLTNRKLHVADQWDRFLVWNMSESKAYIMFKRDIPIAELFTLHQTYNTFVRTILAQPDNEQDFDSDISFNAPFLDIR